MLTLYVLQCKDGHSAPVGTHICTCTCQCGCIFSIPKWVPTAAEWTCGIEETCIHTYNTDGALKECNVNQLRIPDCMALALDTLHSCRAWVDVSRVRHARNGNEYAGQMCTSYMPLLMYIQSQAILLYEFCRTLPVEKKSNVHYVGRVRARHESVCDELNGKECCLTLTSNAFTKSAQTG